MPGPRRVIRRRSGSRRRVGLSGPSKPGKSNKSSKRPRKTKVYLIRSTIDDEVFEVVRAPSKKKVKEYVIRNTAKEYDMTLDEAREFVEDRIYIEEADLRAI